MTVLNIRMYDSCQTLLTKILALPLEQARGLHYNSNNIPNVLVVFKIGFPLLLLEVYLGPQQREPEQKLTNW